MTESITLSEFKRAEEAVAAEEARTGFEIHVVVYVLVNTLLIIINLLNRDGGLWFFYPLIGWGIGLTIHYLAAVRHVKNNILDHQLKIEQRALRERMLH
jgi:2TM domain